MRKIYIAGSRYYQDVLPSILKADCFSPQENYRMSEERLQKQKETCNIHLYVITPELPTSKLILTIAELIEDSVKHPKNTVFLDIRRGPEYLLSYNRKFLQSMDKIQQMVKDNGATVFIDSVEDLVTYLNG